MDILFICKGSVDIGLGHVIRSLSLAKKAYEKNNIEFVLIGTKNLYTLIKNLKCKKSIIKSEDELSSLIIRKYDVVIFDLLEIKDSIFNLISPFFKLKVSISPIINQFEKLDLYFNRTKYFPDKYLNSSVKKYCGLEYNIIKDDCIKIDESDFKKNLEIENIPIAISMGGSDAKNKTQNYLKQLKRVKNPATFWVMLGEGYNHSFDDLVKIIKEDDKHEVILAKTNHSMWQVLKNCVAIILPGGVTTYEAVYAGLPSINLITNPKQEFLLRELHENDVVLTVDLIDEKKANSLIDVVDEFINNREKLKKIHIKSSNLIDNKGSDRILSIIEYNINQKKL
ncbi:MAG: glycosyltransferase [Bacteroidales bacterium]|nr:glycosyltransferase [Bacteroidales bacterium]